MQACQCIPDDRNPHLPVPEFYGSLPVSVHKSLIFVYMGKDVFHLFCEVLFVQILFKGFISVFVNRIKQICVNL